MFIKVSAFESESFSLKAFPLTSLNNRTVLVKILVWELVSWIGGKPSAASNMNISISSSSIISRIRKHDPSHKFFYQTRLSFQIYQDTYKTPQIPWVSRKGDPRRSVPLVPCYRFKCSSRTSIDSSRVPRNQIPTIIFLPKCPPMSWEYSLLFDGILNHVQY